MANARVGIVGSGPMAIHLLKFLSENGYPLDITIFEASHTAGRGMPYRSPAGVDDLPFPSLTRALAGDAMPLGSPFRLSLSAGDAKPIYCLAMSQLLEQHPFSQGLPNCAEFAGVVAADISAGWARGGLPMVCSAEPARAQPAIAAEQH